MTFRQQLEVRLIGRRAAARGACCLLLFLTTVARADNAPARDLLAQAAATAGEIGLSGDQSAARREIALALVRLDPRAALEETAGISRPADAVRALGPIAAAMAVRPAAPATQTAATASRLLARIAQPERRRQETRLFLHDIAPLGAAAPPYVPELEGAEAQAIVVSSFAALHPDTALQLAQTWALSGAKADPALAALAPRLATSHPDAAVTLAAQITAPALRDLTLREVAELQSPQEAVALLPRIQDPLARDGLLVSASLRQAQTDPDAALASLDAVTVSPASARAECALLLAASNRARALELARQLPPLPRLWTLGRLALALADVSPDSAEALLGEAGEAPELVRLVSARMVTVDPARALRLARALPEGEARAAALSDLAVALAPVHTAEARDLLAEISSPHWRARTVRAVALQLATLDGDAATALLGLVTEADDLLPLRAEIAAVSARRDPAIAQRLLAATPATGYRADCAYAAALAQLSSTGSPEAALRLATTGIERDLAIRWLLAPVAVGGTSSAGKLAEEIGQPYLRALGLVDAARALEGEAPSPRPSPDRLRLIRPIVDWEGAG